MSVTVERIHYYYTVVEDKHGKGYWLLELLRQNGVNLRAFTAFPRGAGRSQMDFVPDEPASLEKAAKQAGIELIGPRPAFMVQGEDDVGAIVQLHAKLNMAGINVHAANGVSSGEGKFGYILWVSHAEFDQAAAVLGI